MSRKWKPPKPQRTDAETIRRKKELADKLAIAVEHASEDEFVIAVKTYKPNVGKEELKSWIMRFRDAVRERRGL